MKCNGVKRGNKSKQSVFLSCFCLAELVMLHHVSLWAQYWAWSCGNSSSSSCHNKDTHHIYKNTRFVLLRVLTVFGICCIKLTNLLPVSRKGDLSTLSANPVRRWSFESQCLSSTESFCEQPHKRALKPILPGGKVELGEWGKVDYPQLWQYKIPPQLIKMLVVESLVLVTCWRAMRILWHHTIQTHRWVYLYLYMIYP